jgi:hypothetical protein
MIREWWTWILMQIDLRAVAVALFTIFFLAGDPPYAPAFLDGGLDPKLPPLFSVPPRRDSSAERKRVHVVLIAVDGVRRQEFFSPGRFENDPFPKLRERIRSGELLTFGDPERGETMRVANASARSLPGYQSILSGRDPRETCRGNSLEDCPRQASPTIFERLIEETEGFPPEKLVSVAAWDGVDRAISHQDPPPFFHHSAFAPLLKFGAGEGIDVEAAARWRSAAADDLPMWSGSVRDAYAHALAEGLWRQNHPYLLFVQWVDADEWGHHDDYARYLSMIRAYDAWIAEMIRTAEEKEAAGEWGPTAFVLTTDHGRGEEASWSDHFSAHGLFQPSSYSVWAAIYLPPSLRHAFTRSARPAYDHADIRPTIETLLGLQPVAFGGKSLVDSVPSR